MAPGFAGERTAGTPKAVSEVGRAVKRNVAFVSNYYKTEFFSEIAKRLREEGVGVYWFSVNSRIDARLREDYPAESVLYLGKGYKDKRSEKVGEFKLNELIHGDRALRHYQGWATDYLVNIQKPVYEFIRRNEIGLVLGEITWAHELLIHRICSQQKELGSRYLNLHTVRIPNGRFAFFEDEFQSKIHEVAPSAAGPLQAVPSEAGCAFKVEKPAYLAMNDKALRKSRSVAERLKKIKRFITEENIDPDDPTLIPDRWIRFKVRAAEEVNRELYRLVKKTPFEEVKGRKYVYVALHKQPEASIDVMGRYYDDQLLNITNLWRIVPDDWLVVVKEHTNAIGDRGPGFYRALKRLRNVVLVDELADSYDLIKQSELVATVTGTVAYEAALMGKRSITFAPAFFNRFGLCRNVGVETLRDAGNIQALLASFSDDGVEAASREILEQSFEGVIGDTFANPGCIEKGNIDKIAKAILTVSR